MPARVPDRPGREREVRALASRLPRCRHLRPVRHDGRRSRRRHDLGDVDEGRVGPEGERRHDARWPVGDDRRRRRRALLRQSPVGDRSCARRRRARRRGATARQGRQHRRHTTASSAISTSASQRRAVSATGKCVAGRPSARAVPRLGWHAGDTAATSSTAVPGGMIEVGVQPRTSGVALAGRRSRTTRVSRRKAERRRRLAAQQPALVVLKLVGRDEASSTLQQGELLDLLTDRESGPRFSLGPDGAPVRGQLGQLGLEVGQDLARRSCGCGRCHAGRRSGAWRCLR